MNHGPAWIIFEDSRRDHTRSLLSIVSPRRTARDVARTLEQLYVDRSLSIRERMQYKKSRGSSAYAPMIDGHVIQCGDDPIFVGIYARQTKVVGSVLEFSYRVIRRTGADPANFVLEEKRQALQLDA